jgi:hypothetical protein
VPEEIIFEVTEVLASLRETICCSVAAGYSSREDQEPIPASR